MSHDYLTVAEVHAMHADQIARYGGMHYESGRFGNDALDAWLRTHTASVQPETGQR